MQEFEEQVVEQLTESPAPKATAVAATSNGNGRRRPPVVQQEIRTIELPYPCLGLDLGTTQTRGITGLDYNNPNEAVCIPSPVVEVPAGEVRGLALDMGLGSMDLETNLKFVMGIKGTSRGYMVGQAAIDNGATLTPGKSKLEYAGVKLAASSILLNITGPLAVCFSIPFRGHSEYLKEREQLIETYQEQRIEISLFGREDFIFPEQVYVLPEGLASLYQAQKQGATFSGKKSVVIDWGHFSVDCTLVEYDRRSDSIQFNPTASISIPKGMFQFAKKVSDSLGIPNADSPRLVEAIANPAKPFRYKNGVRFAQVDLAEHLPDLKEEFCEEVVEEICKWFPDADVSDIHLVGGGCSSFHAELRNLFEDGGYSVGLIQPVRLASAVSQFLFCQQMVAKSLV